MNKKIGSREACSIPWNFSAFNDNASIKKECVAQSLFISLEFLMGIVIDALSRSNHLIAITLSFVKYDSSDFFTDVWLAVKFGKDALLLLEISDDEKKKPCLCVVEKVMIEGKIKLSENKCSYSPKVVMIASMMIFYRFCKFSLHAFLFAHHNITKLFNHNCWQYQVDKCYKRLCLHGYKVERSK